MYEIKIEVSDIQIFKAALRSEEDVFFSMIRIPQFGSYEKIFPFNYSIGDSLCNSCTQIEWVVREALRYANTVISRGDNSIV